MIQLILHLIGDYVTQSDWMANNKTKRSFPALVHAIVYSIPFIIVFQPSYLAGSVILWTHFFIDRYRLARFAVMAKNIFFDPDFWESRNFEIRDTLIPKYNTATGYPADAPPWLAVWLLIFADNTLHLTINYLALAYL